ncbi:glycoside hydrolase [Geitlerinema sp. PCC 9228]|jgi:alpha-amylase/alpha-mannosidase (GH57 family)|uniref:glycoside hydrolase n=1 Tax=Geitlerinema sp. PCC 9228 TaxID=111611 RepID=UPI0008F9CE15|nr:glycoside hydrolase [Geitlerinema sp. PCC 9228]
MSHPLYVAFIWHQHQPLYKSYRSGEYRLPWVRLHGTKDYLDLILLLEKYPQLRQTVNLVPSLILQLEDYINDRARDPYLEATLTPVEKLTQGQKKFVLEHFFDANHRTMVDPHPRYAELYEQKQEKGIHWCWENWSLRDYGDLMAWHNLAWIDPIFWDQPAIAKFFQKGRNFTFYDRQEIWQQQRQILARIVAKHKELQDNGQLEVTTSPYTHPILPLLADTDAAKVAMPEVPLPNKRFQYPSDIPRHLQRAIDMYRQRFGVDPKGLWPSEQSVSPDILDDVAQAGFQWLCSDEAVLGWTLSRFFNRDAAGNLQEAELLYRPYRLQTPHGDLSIVFRDHRLSDLIGFTYSSIDPKKAASDLVGYLEAIARQLRQQQSSNSTTLDQPWLVTIALDGENCWEFYQEDGKPFLEHLYQLCSDTQQLQLVTVSEFLDKFPPQDSLPSHQLHSGSWVDGNFATWIGDPIKNRAWDLLYDARKTLENHPEATEETNPAVWEALYAAEGSDWFWWFGEGHSSNQDAIFDQLFREHLADIYEALGEPVPDALQSPLEEHERKGEQRPQTFIHPTIDGAGDEQDWNHAGRIEVGAARGTMHRSSPVQRIWYGRDHLNFYLRLDFQTGKKPGKDFPAEFNLFWYYPHRTMHNSTLPLEELPDREPLNYLFHHHLGIDLLTQSIWFYEAGEYNCWYAHRTRAQVGLDRCLEIAIPWDDLPTEPGWSLELLLVFSNAGHFRSHLPEDHLITIDSP